MSSVPATGVADTKENKKSESNRGNPGGSQPMTKPISNKRSAPNNDNGEAEDWKRIRRERLATLHSEGASNSRTPVAASTSGDECVVEEADPDLRAALAMSLQGESTQSSSYVQPKRPRPSDDKSALAKKWTCSCCTLLNDQAVHFCEVCGSARPQASGSRTEVIVLHDEDGDAEKKSKWNSVNLLPISGPLNATNTSNVSPPVLPERIRIISLNVAGFLPSQEAPGTWDPVPAFRSEILRTDPHVIALQEVPYGKEYGWPGYICIGTCQSHCENVVLLVKEAWAPHTMRLSVPKTPAVLAKMTFVSRSVIFGSCHLSPFGSGSAVRLEQVRAMLDAVAGETTSPLILAGDYNMRKKEDKVIEALGLHDAWKEGGSLPMEKNTWDSLDRTPKGAPAGSGPHNRYHGDGGFPFACRFDRVYIRDERVSVEEFRLIANQPLTNPFHFLSDHFGMTVTLKID